jgi:cell division protein FtsQ
MTTLDVQTNRLYAAVSAYPVVKKLQVSTQFPHSMSIRVIEQLPVAVVEVGGGHVGVAADGTLLHDLASLPALPRIALAVPPGGPRLTEPTAVNAVAAASAAPPALLHRITLISTSAKHGLMAQLSGGPVVYLGDASHLRAKWSALVAVLADTGSAGASYIDVTDPGRPAAGVDAPGTSVAGAVSSTSATGVSATGMASGSVGTAGAVAPGTSGTTGAGGG